MSAYYRGLHAESRAARAESEEEERKGKGLDYAPPPQPEIQKLFHMKYLLAVIKETLRMYVEESLLKYYVGYPS